jgi:hypothetical protein
MGTNTHSELVKMLSRKSLRGKTLTDQAAVRSYFIFNYLSVVVSHGQTKMRVDENDSSNRRNFDLDKKDETITIAPESILK